MDGGKACGTMIQKPNRVRGYIIIEQTKPMNDPTNPTGATGGWALRLRALLRAGFDSVRRRRREEPVNDRASLCRFLQTRANYVAQASLYGYLRTRAGAGYPQLFEDDTFVRSVNIAKWHVWLACLSDLAVYAGGLLARHARAGLADPGGVIAQAVETILEETDTPADADTEFHHHARRVRARVAACDWARVTDDDAAFSESPAALVHWAPVVETLKELDEEIVRNSVRFRWQEIRRALRRCLDAEAVLRAVS